MARPSRHSLLPRSVTSESGFSRTRQPLTKPRVRVGKDWIEILSPVDDDATEPRDPLDTDAQFCVGGFGREEGALLNPQDLCYDKEKVRVRG